MDLQVMYSQLISCTFDTTALTDQRLFVMQDNATSTIGCLGIWVTEMCV